MLGPLGDGSALFSPASPPTHYHISLPTLCVHFCFLFTEPSYGYLSMHGHQSMGSFLGAVSQKKTAFISVCVCVGVGSREWGVERPGFLHAWRELCVPTTRS